MFIDAGHPQAALDVCALSPSSTLLPSSLSPLTPHLPIHTVQLEAMGMLGMDQELEQMTNKVSEKSSVQYTTL